jgi:excisionase family DNA binding protein
MAMNQDLYTVEEVAQRLKLQVTTVRQYLRSGRLKGTRIGKQYRVTQADLEAFAGPVMAQSGRAAANLHRSMEASTIVSIAAIDREKVIRLTNTLMAAANSNRESNEPPLRVETIYDEERALLKVILIGGCTATAYMLGLVQLLADS